MGKRKIMIKIINATEAKNRFGEIIKRVYLGEEHLIVKRGGIPVVAIVPMSEYERLISPEEIPAEVASAVAVSKKEELARRRFIEYLEEAHQRTPLVPEGEAEQDIQEAIRMVRAGE